MILDFLCFLALIYELLGLRDKRNWELTYVKKFNLIIVLTCNIPRYFWKWRFFLRFSLLSKCKQCFRKPKSEIFQKRFKEWSFFKCLLIVFMLMDQNTCFVRAAIVYPLFWCFHVLRTYSYFFENGGKNPLFSNITSGQGLSSQLDQFSSILSALG